MTARTSHDTAREIPEATVDVIRKVPYGGLYEVVVGSEIFYTDDKASYLLLGSIVDMKTRENVTELRMRQLNKVDFASLPFENAIKIVRGNGSRKVAMLACVAGLPHMSRFMAGATAIGASVARHNVLRRSSAWP